MTTLRYLGFALLLALSSCRQSPPSTAAEPPEKPAAQPEQPAAPPGRPEPTGMGTGGKRSVQLVEDGEGDDSLEGDLEQMLSGRKGNGAASRPNLIPASKLP